MFADRRWPQLVSIVAGYLGGIAAYQWLPAISIVPGRTLASGRPLIAFLLPTAALVISAASHSIWKHEPALGHHADAGSTHDAIILRILIFIVAIHLAVLSGLLAVAGVIPPIQFSLARVVPVLLGLLFVTVGNLLPRTQPNLVIGIRIRSAMSNGRVWKDIHRIAGYVSVALGVVLIAAAGLPPGPQVAPVVGGAGFIAMAVIVSYTWLRARA
jgi:hypothetical protein